MKGLSLKFQLHILFMVVIWPLSTHWYQIFTSHFAKLGTLTTWFMLPSFKVMRSNNFLAPWINSFRLSPVHLSTLLFVPKQCSCNHLNMQAPLKGWNMTSIHIERCIDKIPIFWVNRFLPKPSQYFLFFNWISCINLVTVKIWFSFCEFPPFS